MDFLRNSYVGITRAASVPFFNFFKKNPCQTQQWPVLCFGGGGGNALCRLFLSIEERRGDKKYLKKFENWTTLTTTFFRIHSDKGMQKAVSFSFV